MKVLLLTLLLSSTSLIAGGGEGSMGGGAEGIIGNMLMKAEAKNFFVDIPKLNLQGQKVKVIETCIEKNKVRTFDLTDNYPEFVDIYGVISGLTSDLRSAKVKSNYKISLFKKINLDHGSIVIKTNSRIMNIDYRIPECK